MKTLCIHENGSAVVFLDLAELQRLNQSLTKDETEKLSELVIFRIGSIRKTVFLIDNPKYKSLLEEEIEYLIKLNEKILNFGEQNV
jgi:ribosomal protein L30/L7E